MKEAINKYNILGCDYVKLDDLNELLRDMIHKWDAHNEPGYLCDDKGQRIAASGALHHLRVVLNNEKIHVDALMKVMRTRFAREDAEKAAKEGQKPVKPVDVEAAKKTVESAKQVMATAGEALERAEKLIDECADGKTEKARRKGDMVPPRYTVWYRDDGDTTQHCMGFVKFENGLPLFTNRPCNAMWFTWRGIAEKVAEKCGEGFEVVDMWNQMTTEERLLRVIFAEDGMDSEDEPEYHGDGTAAEDEEQGER